MTSTATLKYLNSLAVVQPNNQLNYRSWLNLGLQWLRKGLDYEIGNNIEGAYVEYLKLTSLVLEILPNHSDFHSFHLKEEEIYMKLKKAVTEKLPLIEKWKLLFQKNSTANAKAMSNNNIAKMPPSKPLPAIPTPKSINSSNTTTNTQATISNQSTTSSTKTNNITPAPTLPKTPIGLSNSSTSSFKLPENENITALELGLLWSQSRGGGSNPSILFIDIRPRDQFERYTIKGTNIVNIDLSAIKAHISARELESYLSSRNLKMGHLFSSRHTFDCIVMYDQQSNFIQASSMINGGAIHGSLYDIKLAITEHEYSKKLQKAPYFLIGGLNGWYDYLGDKGLIHHTLNKTPSLSSQNSIDSTSKNSPSLSVNGAIGPARGKPIYHNVSEYLSGQASTIQAQESMMKPRSPQPARLRSPIFEPIPISLTSSNQSDRRKTIFDDHYYNFTGSPPIPEPAKLSHVSPPITPTHIKNQSSYFSSVTPPLTPIPASSAPSSHIGATGLRNLGNTCFMNSIIQCINGTSPLSRHFLDGSYRKQINTKNPLGYKGALAEEFASLIRSLWNGQSSAISPSNFRSLVGTLSHQFKNHDQQDSQEFLAFLLDGLHEDLNLIINKSTLPDIDDDYFEALPDQQASDLAWDRYIKLNDSIIVNLFQGQLKSKLQCQACFKTSTTYNTFMYLSLPIPKLGKFHKSVSLTDCLNGFVKEEILDGDDAWICSRCKVPRKTVKQLSISRLPDILLIHLKRFSFEGPFRNKLDTMVDCPLTKLDLTKYVPSTSAKSSIRDPNGKPLGHVYNLYGVSNHYGTLTGGHYTASVRNGYNGEWRYFDDSQISLINEKKVVTPAAYNLFYVRTNVNG